jgi:uncharacterized GH25 family protein
MTATVMRASFLGVVFLGLSMHSSQAHLSWIRLREDSLKTGVIAHVSLDHGDVFPISEGTLPIDHVSAHVIAPDGHRGTLELKEEGTSLTATYVPQELGLHIFYYVYDPGIMSKTTEGWKIGGKDQFPSAFDRLRGIQTAIAYIFVENPRWTSIRPLGLPIELVPEVVGEDLVLTLLKDSEPFAGAAILVLPPGEEAQSVGTTDDAGMVMYRSPSGFAGEVAFGVKVKLPMPAGSDFKRDVFFTTLCLDFRSLPAGSPIMRTTEE